ncbi:hypothetical protein L873DRAFT_1717024, partial [Choiromyces venosus 120613-1]
IRPIVFITYDKCTFNSNNGNEKIWTYKDKALIRNKGHGQGLHVSNFLTPIGWLDDGGVCKILKYDDKAIPAFESPFPGCQVLWVFDNAKIHQKYASDTLLVGNMNLTPGGKKHSSDEEQILYSSQ